jgi:hypothetical protein
MKLSMIKPFAKALVLVGLAAAASLASAQQYRVSSQVWGGYYGNTSVTSELFGLDGSGNPVTLYGTRWYGYDSDYSSGHSAGSIPPAAQFTSTWNGDVSKGMTSVNAAARAYTTWGSNHVSSSVSNFTPTNYSSSGTYVDAGSGNSYPLTYNETGFTYASAQSTWEELYQIGGGTGTGHFSSSFHIDGVLSPTSAGSGGAATGQGWLNWSLTTFSGETVVSLYAYYYADSDTWYKQTFSGGAWNYESGSGALTINEDLTGGYDFTYGEALYLKSEIQIQADGSNSIDFDNTVKMTSLVLPQGSTVYAQSGASASDYGLVFDGDGSGTVCTTLSCATGGGSGGGGGTTNPVPEPETYALMLLGLAGVLWSTQRQRRNPR